MQDYVANYVKKNNTMCILGSACTYMYKDIKQSRRNQIKLIIVNIFGDTLRTLGLRTVF